MTEDFTTHDERQTTFPCHYTDALNVGWEEREPIQVKIHCSGGQSLEINCLPLPLLLLCMIGYGFVSGKLVVNIIMAAQKTKKK